MSTNASLTQLLGDAGLNAGATQTMLLAADTMGPAIMAGLGDVKLDDIDASEVLLVTLLLDDSGSIRFGSNAQMVRDGHNLVIDALQGAKQSAAVLASCRYLNDGPGTNHCVLYPYRTLAAADRLDNHNYDPMGGTPLYDEAVVTFTGVTAKMAEFENGGVAARAVTLIVTDGADGSHRQCADDVKSIVDGLLRTEAHIVIGMGIDDGYTDFRQVFRGMGILDEWILTPGNTPAEIRRAFATVSQSAVRASQAANFSQLTGIGGFGG